MIYTSVNVKINSNGTATSSNRVVLYRGDREVEIQMALTGNPYIIKESTFAQLIIRRDNATPIITGIAPLKDSKVILTITEENIDELTEVGSYAYQIRLYDDDMSARITLPPVENGLEVREPIVDEASGAIGRAMINYSLISRAAIDENSTFNEYDEYNRTIWRDGDYITDAKMNKIEDALYVINQRVLSNAESAYISTEMQEDQKVGVGESLDISFEFISPNKGKGTLKVSVNGIQKISQYVEQEELITINLPEEYFSKGDNKVTLYVVDRAGKSSNELIFMVRYGSTELTPDFDQYSAYQYGASVRYYFIPSCLDTSSKLLFYMEIDGTPKEPMECTSDVRGYYTFPNNLSVGAHHCKAYLIDGQGNRSNEVIFNLIIIDAYSIVIASDTKNPVIEEGSQLVLDYKIYMENADTFIAKVYVDDVLVSSGECGLETAYYRNSSLTEGTHIIRIEAWNKEETISDYVVWNVIVTESVFDKIVPATAGGIFLASATDHSNSDQNRDKWVGVDQDGNEVIAQLENFTFDSESGWVDNELVFGGVAKAVIPIKPLANNARYGFTLDLEFTSTEIGAEGALVLDLWDYTKDCGIKITTEKLRLRSAEGNEASLYFEDSTNTSVIFVIDRNEKKAKIYLNGVMCSAFNLSDYESNGKWILEDFTVDDYIRLGGKGSSKIRNLRVYQVALTTNEIINNFISNKQSKDEQKELVEFQKGLHLPTLTIYCDFSGLGKDDKKPCKIVYSSTDEEKYGKSFELDHKESSVQYQGTSSMAYPIKNYRINLRDENGDKLYYDFPFGQPECRFTLKADFMSSGHWQNTGLTKWINDNLYNYNEKDEKSMNPKKWFDLQNGGSLDDTRECIYGFPCRLILVNDGTTPLNTGQNEPTPGNTKDMGIFNFNHDKDATDTLGFDKDNFPNCMGFEVTANSDTSAGAFMRYTGGGTQEDELEYYKQSFELRFPDEDDVEPWYGFLGINAGTMVTDFYKQDDDYSTSYWEWDIFNTALHISSDKTIKSIECYNYDEFLINMSVNATEKDVTLVDGVNKIRFIFDDKPEYFYINDTKYILGNEISELSLISPYLGEEISPEYGIKRLVEWVDTCSDEEFVRDFEQYFHKDYTLRYYLLVITLGMVDNLGKNMMLDSWDGKIFMPRFYDCDTICSYDNTGDIAFDVDIEMEQGYWNTSSSRLWTRIRDLMHPELVEKYNNMRQNGLSYDSLMNCFYDEQIAKIPQKYYNMDYDVKYAPFGDSYMGMAHGDGYEHLKRWLKKRILFVDSLFDYAPSYTSDMLTIRANTTETMSLTIETYDPQYVHVSWYNGQMDKIKVDGKTPVTFTGKAMAATDQEVLIYGGTNIKKLSGISTMNPGELIIGAATRLAELDASNCPILTQINLNKANLSAHPQLIKLNLSNCPELGGNLRIDNSKLIQELNIENTAISGINFPPRMRNLLKLKVGGTNITSLDLSIWDTSNVTDMSYMFRGCTSLTSLEGIENWDMSNVANMNYMFANCTNITNLEGIGEWDTSKVTGMGATFSGCGKLTSLEGIENWKTSSVINMTYMFNGCYNLTSLDLSGFDTSNVTSMDSMFYACSNLTSLDLSGFDTSNVTSMNSMFYSCSSLTSLDVSGFDTSNITYMSHMFSGCSKLTSLDLSGFDTSNVTNMGGMFNSCSKLTSLDLSGFDTSKVTNMGGMFNSCNNLIEINAENCSETTLLKIIPQLPTRTTEQRGYITTRTTTDEIIAQANAIYWFFKMGYTIAKFTTTDATKLPVFNSDYVYAVSDIIDNGDGTSTIDITSWDDFSSVSFNGNTALVGVEKLKVTSNVSNMHAMFYNCNNLTSLDVSGFDTSSVTTMASMFSNCGKLTSLDVSGFDTSSVTSMYAMFNGCSSLTSLDVSGFDTSKVATMASMFSNCSKLTSLDVSGFDTSNVTGMSYMFNNCSSLTSLDVSGFDTSSVTDMGSMFYNCYGLTSLDVSSFDTSKVTDMYNMFYSCANLTSLDLSNFDTSKVTDMGNMFNNCSSLTSLNVMMWPLNDITQTAISSLPVGDDVKNEIQASSYFTIPTGWILIYINPYDIAIYTCNASGVLPTFNTGYTGYTVEETDNGDGTYTTYIRTNDLDVMPNQYSFKSKSALLSVEKLKVTSNVTSMANMFNGCTKLTSLDLSNFDTSNVTSMSSMFQNCNKIASLDVSGFDTSKVTDMNGMFRYCGSLTSLDVSNFNTSQVTDMSSMFYSCSSLTSLEGIENWNTSQVTKMNGMFQSCKKLTSLEGIGEWDTSNVAGLHYMFRDCINLTSLDLSNFDTSKVTDMSYMFQDCSNLTSLDVSEWDTSKVTNMSSMFRSCTNLTSLNVSSFNTSKVTDMNNMFIACTNLASLDVSSFDTSNVTDMSYMFQSCTNLTSLNVSSFNTSNVTSMSNMFSSCSSLKSLNVEGWPLSDITQTAISTLSAGNGIDNLIYASANFTVPTGWTLIYSNPYDIAIYTCNASGVVPTFNTGYTGYSREETDNGDGTYTTYIRTNDLDVMPTQYSFSGKTALLSVEKLKVTSNVTNTSKMFSSCTSLTSLNLSGWNTSNVTDMANMFQYCSKLTSIEGIGEWNTSKVTTMTSMFFNCTKLTSLDLSGWNTSNVTTMNYMFQYCNNLTSIEGIGEWDTSNVTTMAGTFQYCNNLTSLEGIGDWDTSNVTDMTNMFYNCTNLTSLDLSGWNTSNVTIMTSMFSGCSKLTSLEGIENWDTSNVTNMYYMFYKCSNLTSLESIENWDTSKVTNMSGMFNGCSSLTSLDVSGFDTSEVTNMSSMFSICSGLTSLDLSGFDTSNVTGMSYMFNGCSKLTSLDLSGWDTSNVTNMSGMFQNCSNVTSLECIGELETSKVTNIYYMFNGCSSLTSLDLSGFDTSNVTTMTGMFNGCSNLKTLNVEGWSLTDKTQDIISALSEGNGIDNLIYASVIFTMPTGWTLIYNNTYDIVVYTCNALGVLPTFNTGYTGYSSQQTKNGDGTYTTYIRTNDLDVMPTQYSFSGKTALLSVEKLKVTSNVTDMSYMFYSCTNLTSIEGIGEWNTSNVTNMQGTFSGCKALTSLDVSGFDTSNVTNMNAMFYNCSSLTSLDLSSFDTSKVTNTVNMFANCSNLASLKVSSWNTSNVTDMGAMFANCSNLTSLDLSGFDTSKVTNMNNTFYYCSNLASLDSMMNISCSLTLSNTILDISSLLDVIDNLATLTTAQTLTLGTTLLAKLTEEQIAVATNKGWTVA